MKNIEQYKSCEWNECIEEQSSSNNDGQRIVHVKILWHKIIVLHVRYGLQLISSRSTPPSKNKQTDKKKNMKNPYFECLVNITAHNSLIFYFLIIVPYNYISEWKIWMKMTKGISIKKLQASFLEPVLFVDSGWLSLLVGTEKPSRIIRPKLMSLVYMTRKVLFRFLIVTSA